MWKTVSVILWMECFFLIFFFKLQVLTMTTLKTVVAWKMAINAWLLLICLVIIFCLCKRGQILLVSALYCSSPLFRVNNLSPLLNTKATLGARLLVPWWPASFIFFQCSFREKHGIIKSDVFDWEKEIVLGCKERNCCMTRVNAVILSINTSIWLVGWCQVSICQRETGWHRHCLTLQYGRPRHKIENYHLFLGLA